MSLVIVLAEMPLRARGCKQRSTEPAALGWGRLKGPTKVRGRRGPGLRWPRSLEEGASQGEVEQV